MIFSPYIKWFRSSDIEDDCYRIDTTGRKWFITRLVGSGRYAWIEMDVVSKSVHCFETLQEAKQGLNEYLIGRGHTLIDDQERFEKLKLLI